jgi:hypothetical protein
MRDSSIRLGALAGQWDVPDPDELTARLQPEPDVAHRFYERSILSSEHGSFEDRSTAETGSEEEIEAALARSGGQAVILVPPPARDHEANDTL